MAVSKGKHQQWFFLKSCVEGNRILICMTGQPNSGQPWHSPVPQWHKEEWLTTIFQLWSQFSLPSLPELSLRFSYQFGRGSTTWHHNIQQSSNTVSQVLVNKALFGGRQAAWVLNRVTITTMLQILKWRWLNQIVSNYRKCHYGK